MLRFFKNLITRKDKVIVYLDTIINLSNCFYIKRYDVMVDEYNEEQYIIKLYYPGTEPAVLEFNTNFKKRDAFFDKLCEITNSQELK